MLREEGSFGIGLSILVGGLLVVLAAWSGLVLPYLLPLGGPETLSPSALADPGGAFVSVAGERLYYTHKSGSGPAVVLIHGFGGSTVSWRDTIPALATAGYDVYAIDLVGFGLSEKGWDRDYSHQAQAARVAGFMAALGIRRATIVGHSMGGSVAAHVALRYPNRVDQLVLVSPSLLDDDNRDDGLLPISVPVELLDLPPLRRWAQIALRELVAPEFDALLFDAAYRDDMLDSALVADYRRVLHTPRWDLALLGMTRDAGGNMLGDDALRAIDIPVLLVWGAGDTWVPVRLAAQLEVLLSEAEHVEFAGVGHLPMHEVPEQFNRALLDYLAR